MKLNRVSRRGFLKAGIAVAGTGPLIVPARVFGASNRITVGMIGMGRQATHTNVKQFLESPNAQVVAVCDIDAWRLENARKVVVDFYAKQSGKDYKGCATFHDFRELLARKDIDAVMISTPDHWHVPIGIAAARAGKHVSVEKPLSTAIVHGRLLCDAVKKAGVMNRTDSEFRSLPAIWKAVQCVRNGRIGKLERMVTFVPEDTPGVGDPPAMPVPEELDYDRWLGPAPEKPYTEQRVHARHTIDARPGWIRISDYANGMIANWGTHMNDVAQWANNTDRTGPVSVEGTGEFSKGLWDTITAFKVHYEYANGVTLDYRIGQGGPPAPGAGPANDAGIEFHGSGGWIKVLYPDKIDASDPAILRDPEPGQLDFSGTLSDKEDFLHAIRTGKESLEPVEVGHRTVSMCQIALIAIQTGRKLKWDPDREKFIDDDGANALLDRPARGEWMKGG